MRVFKFGGASVKDAAGVRNMADIIRKFNTPLVVVVSAMGKTTNTMENLVDAYFKQDSLQIEKQYNLIRTYHNQIVEQLFDISTFNLLDDLLNQLWERLQKDPSLNYDFEYDQIVPYGELLSTTLVSTYLNYKNVTNEWVDIRKILKTDDNYRHAGVNWELTNKFIQQKFNNRTNKLFITQGFIGSTENNITTTLGREGSDYTGAVIAHALDASDLSIWKDVPGVLNADPRWYPKAEKIDELSYWEAIELTYYGAQVIHPKTLKPLQNKMIPLFVNSFIEPEKTGTIIKSSEQNSKLSPIFVLKPRQVLISISPKDFSFIIEENMSEIFHLLSKHKIKINMMQTSALNFSVCVDNTNKIKSAISELTKKFNVLYNDKVELVTIRHYTSEAINELINGKHIVDSQISRKTARYVLKESEWIFN